MKSKLIDITIKAAVFFFIGFIMCAGIKAAEWIIPAAPREPLTVIYECDCTEDNNGITPTL